MATSKVKIWVHTVFAPKYRQPILIKELQPEIWKLIRDEFATKDCFVHEIGGIEDHVHVLHLLTQKISLMELIKQVKGATSHEINSRELIRSFSWQKGYGGFSVSPDRVETVANYIRKQEDHHRRKEGFEQEYRALLDRAGLDFKDDLMFKDEPPEDEPTHG